MALSMIVHLLGEQAGLSLEYGGARDCTGIAVVYYFIVLRSKLTYMYRVSHNTLATSILLISRLPKQLQ